MSLVDPQHNENIESNCNNLLINMELKQAAKHNTSSLVLFTIDRRQLGSQEVNLPRNVALDRASA